MADRRKLQGEIDRCLKKVTEGVETFEDIWQKVHNATNTNQKEKYEADLKKEIKKLQRLRDQIKTWLASSEIKDKRQLIENRKLIETQMERFKVVERETKTKAYSKEGLGAAQKLDPIQKERDEITNWLSNSIDTLGVQVDQFESEIEALQLVQKKGKKPDRDKVEKSEQLKNRVEQHRYHVKQLETLMRMLDNDTVTVDQIKKIKDDIEYYIESSNEDDFQDNEYIYDDLDLEDMNAFRANNVVDSTICPLTKSASTTSASESKANNSSNAASVDNDDSNAQSNSSSTNDSPAPSPSLVNSHSSSKTTNNTIHEFAFTSSSINSSTAITTTTILSTSLPSSKAIWPNSTPAVNSTSRASANMTPNPNQSTTNTNTTTPPISAPSAPYAAAAAVASLANSSAKVLAANDISNDTRAVNNASNSSAHDPLNHPSTSTVVTLYSAAAAAASASVTSTASATTTTNPWSNTVSGSTADLSNHQMLGSRQISNGSSQPLQLTPAQQMLLQQQGGHLLNGYKGGLSSVDPQTLKSVTQPQSVSSSGVEEHLDSSLMNALGINMNNLNLGNNANSNVANSFNQIGHLNDLNNSGAQNSSLNSAIHSDHTDLFVKNNLLIHQQAMAGNPPSSISPSTNLNSVSSVPPNLSNNFSSSNISNVDAPISVNNSHNNNSVNTPLVNSTSQSQSQNFFTSFGSANPLNKSALSKQFIYQMHLLESAYRHPIIPLDSHRLKPLTKMAPTATTPLQMANYPNQTMPQFDSLEFYQRLAPETLFFVFYYMEGTKAQYLAAKTLKNQSWRFHTKCMMWFQRLEEPKVITEEYEQGTYIYFDFERWQQRKKEGFIFEYKYLEDKDLN